MGRKTLSIAFKYNSHDDDEKKLCDRKREAGKKLAYKSPLFLHSNPLEANAKPYHESAREKKES